MKKILMTVVVLVILSLNVFASSHGEVMKDDSFSKVEKGKKAILMVHFGSTYADTRMKTIDKIDEKVKEKFPDFEVRRAFTSRIIMRILKKRDGVIVDNPSQALHKLAAEGYTHIAVQASHIINGTEAETLRREIEENFPNSFEVVRVGNSMLSSVEDYKVVANALYTEMTPEDKEALVLVGHGTHHHGNAAYGMMDSVLKYEGLKNAFVSTVEGYPTLDTMKDYLIKQGYKKIKLVPFMFVAGTHAREDIDGDYKEEFLEEGFEVEVIMKGLGENEKIQNLFIDHLIEAIETEPEDMLKKKKAYSKGK